MLPKSLIPVRKFVRFSGNKSLSPFVLSVKPPFREVLLMKKLLSLLLFLSLLLLAFSASAQTVSVPSAGFTLTVPDSFTELPGDPDNPDLVLHLADSGMDLTVYVSYFGRGTVNDLLILTGDETGYGSVTLNGKDMVWITGQDGRESFKTYSWLRKQDSVSLYFIWSGSEDATLRAIDEIMSSISFK